MGLRVQGPSEKQRRRAAQSYKPQLEPLEPRQLLTTTLIDNGDPGFEQTGFTYQSNSQVESAYDGDNHNMRGGGEEGTATWTFENVADGEYQVAATWAHKYENKYNAIDAPFTIADVGGNLLASTTVDQSYAPSDFPSGGYSWDSLGTVSITGGSLVVTLGAGSSGNQYTVADAVRIEKLSDIAPALESTPATDVTGNEQLNQDLTANDNRGESDPIDFTHTVDTEAVAEIPATDEATGTAALGAAGGVTLLGGENTTIDQPSTADANEPVDPKVAFKELEGWTIEIIMSTWEFPLSFSLLEWDIEDRFYNVTREQNRYEFYFSDAPSTDSNVDSHCVVQRMENGDIQIDYEIIPTTVFSHVLKDKEGVTRINVGNYGSGSYTIVAPSRYTSTNPYGVTSLLQVGSQIYPLCLYGCDIENFDGGSNPQPIIGGNYRLPYVVSVPERLEARLTFGGVLHDWVYYDTSGLAAGDSVALNLAADVPELTSGRHAYSIEVREITGGNAVTRTISGHREIFNRGGSEFGDRWWLESQKRIVVADDGVSVFDDGAGGYWYEEVAGTDQFITPLSRFDTLVREDGVYTITDPRGNREAFNALGLLVSTTDRNGNLTSYTYVDANPNDNDTVADEIRSITDPYEREKLFDYNNDGRLDTITNSAKSDDSGGRVTAFSYDAEGNLTQVTRPDPDPDDGIAAPVTEFSYDANGFMTGVREGSASASGTTMVGNFANRLTSTTNADETVWSLEAALTVGLVEPGSGLPGTSPENPMPAVTADQSKTTLTDERGFETLITFDRYGGQTSRVDALDNTYLWDRDYHGRVTRAVAPAAGGGTLETSFSYDDRGNLIQTDYADGTHESWAYETSFNQLTSYTDQLDRQTVYDIDPANGNVLAVTRVVGQLDSQSDETDDVTRSFTYTDSSNAVVAGLLKTETDPLGSVTEYKYFDTANSCGCHSGLLKSITVGLGTAAEATTEYEYDEAGNLSAEIDPLDRRTEYEYDNLDRLIRMTQIDPEADPEADTPETRSPRTLYTYNAIDQLLTETDPLDNETSYTYDAMGRLETITNKAADGTELSATSYTYDAAGNLETEKDELENITRYDYDDLGRLVKTTLPDADGDPATTDDIPVFEYTYDAAGNLESETDPLMNVTSYDYDALGRLVKTTLPDADGDPDTTGDIPVIEYTYYATGQLKSEEDPLGNKTSYDYDDLGRLIRTTLPDPDGDPATTGDIPVFKYTYDAAGNLLSEKDAFDNGTSYLYDDLGRLKTAIETGSGGAALSETGYTYDTAGNLLSVTDPVGNVTSWIYDDLNRPIEEQNDSGFSRLMQYDAAGNLTARTDRNDRQIEYGYDDLHRRTTEQWLDENDFVIHQFDTLYDPAGQIISAGDGVSDYQYTYDHLGRVTDRTENYEYIKFRVNRDNDYDRMGNRTRTAIKFGGMPGAITETTYDNLYRTTRIEQYGVEGGVPVAEKRVDFSYDQAGQWDTITRYQDLAGQHLAVTTDYAFDPAGRMTGITHAAGDGTVLAGYGWTYDAAQRVTHFDSLIDGATVYNYDDLDQLTGATSDYQGSETYEYDEAGNRTGGPYVTGLLNQLEEDADYLYCYDNEGNRTARIDKQTGETTLYEWDYRNRLTTISSYDCDPEVFGNAVLRKTVTQTYDIWNQWIRREVDSGSPLVADTYFIYDAGQLVMSLNALRTSNMAQGRISSANRYLWGPAVDQLLAEEGVRLQGSEGTLWQLTDNLGSVRDLAEYDEASGTTSVVNHITYDSFGNVTSETAAVDHLFGYTGRAYDEETGLQNNHNRWYDAANGKWLSEDPIGFDGGDANLYRYAFNDVTRRTDPTGEIAPVIFGIALGGAVAIDWIWPDAAAAPANQADCDLAATITENNRTMRCFAKGTLATGLVCGPPALRAIRPGGAGAPATIDVFAGTGGPAGFGRLIGWGKGAVEATARTASLKACELQAAGISAPVAKYWLDFYQRAAANGQGGQTAIERIKLMQRALELLGK